MDGILLTGVLGGVFGILLLKYLSTDVTRTLLQQITTRHSNLPFSPNTLCRTDIVFLFLLMTLKHGLKLVGLDEDVEIKEDGYVLPESSVTASIDITTQDLTDIQDKVFDADIQIDRLDQAHDGSVAFRLNDLFLPCITSVMLPFLLAKFSMPISPLGALNTRNRFEFLNLNTCLQPLGKTLLTVSIGGDSSLGRRTRKGREFDVTVEARLEDQKEPYFRQIFTIFEFLPSHTMPLYDDTISRSQPTHIDDDKQLSEVARIVVPGDATWRWASFCKDYNPIHISNFIARLFGFSGRIVHGNHLAAMAIQATGSLLRPSKLQSSHNTKSSKSKFSRKGRFIEVKFIKPVTLGSEVSISSSSEGKLLLKSNQQTVMTIIAGDV